MNQLVIHRTLSGLLLCGVLAGCKIGQTSVLFSTNTTLGVDLDSAPPTMDIAYGRGEMVLGPTFEENQVLPVLSSVGSGAGGFGLTSNHSFATGDAAVILGNALTDPRKVNPTEYGIRPFNNGGVIKTTMAPGDRRRFFFGTKTVIGASLQWNELNVPEAVSLGLKRKELAFVPLVEKNGEVRLSSLIATADAGIKVGGPADSGMRVGQMFATGEAATALARHGAIRRVLGPAIIPQYQEAQAYADAMRHLDSRTRAVMVRAQVYQGLKELATKGDKTAAGWITQLDALPAPKLFDYDSYILSGAAPGKLTITPAGAKLTQTGFNGLLEYRAPLLAGIAALEAALASPPTGGVSLVDVPGATPEEKSAHLRKALAELTQQLQGHDETWSKNAVIQSASEYFITGRTP